MLIPHGTIVAVADGAGLALFRNTGTETALKLSPLPAPSLDAHSKDAGKRHRSSTANPDRKLIQEDSLAAAIAGWLNHEALEGRIQNLVVVAPPKFLGEIRRLYHKAVESKLIGELGKDIREMSLTAIEHELKLAKLP